MSNEYKLELDYFEIDLLRFINEVTLNRQLNYLASNKKLINKVESQIKKTKDEISHGKIGFFSNNEDKLRKLNNKLSQLLEKRREPERDLKIAKGIYDKILNSYEKIRPGNKALFIKEEYLKEREHMHVYGDYKEYFKIEHYIY